MFGSTAFLIGAAQQLRMMFEPTRIVATGVYLGCVVLALVCALLVRLQSCSSKFHVRVSELGSTFFSFHTSVIFCLLILQIHSKILTIVAIICEICALIW